MVARPSRLLISSRSPSDNRPKFERSIAWLIRRGGRKVRYRGIARNRIALAHRCAAIDLRRLLTSVSTGTRIVLTAADDEENVSIAKRLGVAWNTVIIRRKRFYEERIDGLSERCPCAGSLISAHPTTGASPSTSPARDGYDDSVLPRGHLHRRTEEAVDCAYGLYLNDITARTETHPPGSHDNF